MPPIDLDLGGSVAEVRLNRPKLLNASDAETDRGLADAWAPINGDPAIRVAILSAVGERAFCAGGIARIHPMARAASPLAAA